MLVENYKDYNEQKTSTNVEKKYVSEHTFPSVSICNLQFFKPTSPLRPSVIRNLALNNVTYPNLQLPYNFTAKEYMNYLIIISKFMLISAYSDNILKEDQLFTYGYPIEENLVSCNFKDTKCDPSDFTRFFSVEYGSCYAFNSSRISSKTNTGVGYGLQLELFTGTGGKLFQLVPFSY